MDMEITYRDMHTLHKSSQRLDMILLGLNKEVLDIVKVKEVI